MDMILIDWFDQNDRIGTPGRAQFQDPIQAARKIKQLSLAPTIISININYGTGRQYWTRAGHVPQGTWQCDYDYDSDRDNVAQPVS